MSLVEKELPMSLDSSGETLVFDRDDEGDSSIYMFDVVYDEDPYESYLCVEEDE